MDQHLQVVVSEDSSRPNLDAELSTVDSNRLMKGRRELMIRHGISTYRLRVTASNKLILTK